MSEITKQYGYVQQKCDKECPTKVLMAWTKFILFCGKIAITTITIITIIVIPKHDNRQVGTLSPKKDVSSLLLLE